MQSKMENERNNQSDSHGVILSTWKPKYRPLEFFHWPLKLIRQRNNLGCSLSHFEQFVDHFDVDASHSWEKSGVHGWESEAHLISELLKDTSAWKYLKHLRPLNLNLPGEGGGKTDWSAPSSNISLYQCQTKALLSRADTRQYNVMNAFIKFT